MAELEALEHPGRLSEQFGTTHWIEIQRDTSSPVPIPTAQLVESTRRAGGVVELQVFKGEPFWTAVEIVINEAVLEATTNCFRGLAPTGDFAGCT